MAINTWSRNTDIHSTSLHSLACQVVIAMREQRVDGCSRLNISALQAFFFSIVDLLLFVIMWPLVMPIAEQNVLTHLGHWQWTCSLYDLHIPHKLKLTHIIPNILTHEGWSSNWNLSSILLWHSSEKEREKSIVFSILYS